MNSDNKAIVRRVFDEVINREDRGVIDEIFAPDVLVHDPLSGTQHGIDSLKQLLAMFDTAFPHHRVEVQQLTAEDDYVSVLHTHVAQQNGPFMGLPPTGKQVRVGGVELFRLEHGAIVEFWRHDDDVGLLRQLGLIAEPQPAAAEPAMG